MLVLLYVTCKVLFGGAQFCVSRPKRCLCVLSVFVVPFCWLSFRYEWFCCLCLFLFFFLIKPFVVIHGVIAPFLLFFAMFV